MHNEIERVKNEGFKNKLYGFIVIVMFFIIISI